MYQCRCRVFYKPLLIHMLSEGWGWGMHVYLRTLGFQHAVMGVSPLWTPCMCHVQTRDCKGMTEWATREALQCMISARLLTVHSQRYWDLCVPCMCSHVCHMQEAHKQCLAKSTNVPMLSSEPLLGCCSEPLLVLLLMPCPAVSRMNDAGYVH